MLIDDLANESDLFDSVLDMMAGFSDDLVCWEIFLQSSGIGDDTVGAELATARGDWDESCLSIGVGELISCMWYDIVVLIGQFDVSFLDFITQATSDTRDEANIIDTHDEFEIGKCFLEVEKHRIECVIDEDDVVRVGIVFFEVFHFLVGEADDLWITSGDITDEVSAFHEFGCGFVMELFGDFGMAEIVLDHTSGDPNLFVRRYFTYFASDFVFRFLADGASVQDDDICLIDGVDMSHADIGQDSSDTSCVGVVHLTAEDDDVESGHRNNGRKRLNGRSGKNVVMWTLEIKLNLQKKL